MNMTPMDILKKQYMIIPAVRWEFIGCRILTTIQSLDIFDFDIYGVSRFQPFFDKYDTSISYCFEGNYPYLCFSPKSKAIILFVSWLVAHRTAQILRENITHTEYLNYIKFREEQEVKLRINALNNPYNKELPPTGLSSWTKMR